MKIPLSETEALVGLLALKPTASMPPAKGESNWEEEGTSEEDQVIGSPPPSSTLVGRVDRRCIPFVIVGFATGIVPGVSVLAIICGGTVLSLKKFPLPKD